MVKKEQHFKQGFFRPNNPKKYRGDPTNIVYRSGWEKRVMEYLDNNMNITRWASEEIIIPYYSPIDNKYHKYYPDFYVEAIGRDGETKKMLLEVKPQAQTQEPKSQQRMTKRYITEVMTYGVNQAKWHAAEEYCRKKGWEFKLITERELFGKNNK
jgi:hypothetical protein